MITSISRHIPVAFLTWCSSAQISSSHSYLEPASAAHALSEEQYQQAQARHLVQLLNSDNPAAFII